PCLLGVGSIYLPQFCQKQQGKEKRRPPTEINGILFIRRPFIYLGLRACQEMQYRSLKKNMRSSGTIAQNSVFMPVSIEKTTQKQVMTCSSNATFDNL
ncbi:hypothetical protein KA183_20395, partial [bacterium]|nr:hypothetical protein [bacterium]